MGNIMKRGLIAGAVGLCLVVFTILGTLLATGYFSGSKTGQESRGVEKDAKPKLTEEEARAALKIVLDAWVFGDAYKDFKTKHPELEFNELDWNEDSVLLRYEITTSRKDFSGYEFAVILNLQTRAKTELTKPRKYAVFKLGDKLCILVSPD